MPGLVNPPRVAAGVSGWHTQLTGRRLKFLVPGRFTHPEDDVADRPRYVPSQDLSGEPKNSDIGGFSSCIEDRL